jgi:hypothetical protein
MKVGLDKSPLNNKHKITPYRANTFHERKGSNLSLPKVDKQDELSQSNDEYTRILQSEQKVKRTSNINKKTREHHPSDRDIYNDSTINVIMDSDIQIGGKDLHKPDKSHTKRIIAIENIKLKIKKDKTKKSYHRNGRSLLDKSLKLRNEHSPYLSNSLRNSQELNFNTGNIKDSSPQI